MDAKVHIAGAPEPSGAQPCSRCGGDIIEKPRGELMTGDARFAPLTYDVGSEIVVATGTGFRFCTERASYQGVAEVCAPARTT